MVREVKYVEIAETLASRITDGTYPLGKRLPGVRALTTEFGVSDLTIRNALGRLAELGLVEGRERVGTIVIATEARQTTAPERRSLAQRVADLERRMDQHETDHP